MTRPEPTIYGNCDSWDLIVGRKPLASMPKGSLKSALSVCDTHVIHSLFTKWKGCKQDNLWASCGSVCTSLNTPQLDQKFQFHMPD
ncbi:MAG: hypothetical protein RLZZ470_807 [Pseudomonadota bacterium]